MQATLMDVIGRLNRLPPLPADADLARYTTLRFRARIGGQRHGFLHVAVSNEPKLSSIMLASAPPGSPPPFGPMHVQKSVW